MATKSSGFTVECTIEKEEGGYSSVCKKLGIASCGDDINEALENLVEAIDVHLETLRDIGQLEKFLKDKGVTLVLGIEYGERETSMTIDGTRRAENSYVWHVHESPICSAGWVEDLGDAELNEVVTEQEVFV